MCVFVTLSLRSTFCNFVAHTVHIRSPKLSRSNCLAHTVQLKTFSLQNFLSSKLSRSYVQHKTFSLQYFLEKVVGQNFVAQKLSRSNSQSQNQLNFVRTCSINLTFILLSININLAFTSDNFSYGVFSFSNS